MRIFNRIRGKTECCTVQKRDILHGILHTVQLTLSFARRRDEI